MATFEGATWKEALAKVPCQDVAKDGKDLKITGIIVVDGESSLPRTPQLPKKTWWRWLRRGVFQNTDAALNNGSSPSIKSDAVPQRCHKVVVDVAPARDR